MTSVLKQLFCPCFPSYYFLYDDAAAPPPFNEFSDEEEDAVKNPVYECYQCEQRVQMKRDRGGGVITHRKKKLAADNLNVSPLKDFILIDEYQDD